MTEDEETEDEDEETEDEDEETEDEDEETEDEDEAVKWRSIFMCTITNVLYVFVCYLCAAITVNFTIVVNL